MNVFKIHRGVREVGITYGLPVWFIDFGPGLSLEPEKVVEKMLGMGLDSGMWVVLKNKPLTQKGIALLIQGLVACKVAIEVEDSGSGFAPPWFTSVTRWMVNWKLENTFNYGALRSKQDMLLLQSQDIGSLDRFLLETQELLCLRAIICNGDKKEEVFNRVKDFGVRIYVK